MKGVRSLDPAQKLDQRGLITITSPTLQHLDAPPRLGIGLVRPPDAARVAAAGLAADGMPEKHRDLVKRRPAHVLSDVITFLVL